MFSVRILTASAALILVTGLGQTPAYTCDNIFFPCQQTAPPARTSPNRVNTGVPVTTGQPVLWGLQPAPANSVVTQPSNRVVAKPTKRRTAKYRARQRPAAKPVATVTKPAATVTKPAATVAKPTATVAKPAPEPALSAARSVTIAAASVDELARVLKREATSETDAVAKMIPVVNAGEVNEIDLAAGPPRTVIPVASAAVEESKGRESVLPINASISQLLIVLVGAVAAACVFRAVT